MKTRFSRQQDTECAPSEAHGSHSPNHQHTSGAAQDGSRVQGLAAGGRSHVSSTSTWTNPARWTRRTGQVYEGGQEGSKLCSACNRQDLRRSLCRCGAFHIRLPHLQGGLVLSSSYQDGLGLGLITYVELKSWCVCGRSKSELLGRACLMFMDYGNYRE